MVSRWNGVDGAGFLGTFPQFPGIHPGEGAYG